MGYSDELKALTVRIGGEDGGSGVIVKPLDANVLYILTAWHCIENETEETVEFSFADSLYAGVDIKVEKIYKDEKTDAAIIVVERFDESVRFIGFADKPDDPHVNGYHTGFPSKRADEDGVRAFAIRDVNRIWHDKNNLVEYTYTPVPQKHELIGLSGGGVFNDKYQLLGIHKQSAYEDKVEQLGAACYIPCSCYNELLKEKGLPLIYEFDLSSFKPFIEDIFKFDNLAAMRDLETLLGGISLLQNGLNKKCPKKMFETFQEKRKCSKKIVPVVLSKNDWILFGEFLIATKLLKPEEIDDFEVNKIVPNFQYVYSEKDFDMLEVRKCIDINQMGQFMGYGCVYVIGGIKSKTASYDVLRGSKVPDISMATSYEEFDIADDGRKCMNNLTFVNCHLFRDVMVQNGSQLKDKGGKELEAYQTLLKQMVYG